MPKIFATLAGNLDLDLLQAALPLLESEKVEAFEWSFDVLYTFKEIPVWFSELVAAFSTENRLIGHGVFFSLFSGKWKKEQQDWLNYLEETAKTHPFNHITEHFGFMTGKNFHEGAPLSIPFTKSTLALGKDRLKRIQAACNCPVGLENLAFSYALEDVKQQGDFLNELVEAVNGFIILDVHNLYCQSHNFDIPFDEIMALYPLEKVREIHISGGSWENVSSAPEKKIRRDTHDSGVPSLVFEYLKHAMPLCPNLQFVVMEQLGTGLKTAAQKQQFRADFLAMDALIQKENAARQTQGFVEKYAFLPKKSNLLPQKPFEDLILHNQQIILSHILETAPNVKTAQALIAKSDLAHSDWATETWQPEMLETAIAIAQKWKSEHTVLR
jgi:uncharacterized protein